MPNAKQKSKRTTVDQAGSSRPRRTATATAPPSQPGSEPLVQAPQPNAGVEQRGPGPSASCQSHTILLIGDSMIHWLAAFAHRKGKQGLGSAANVVWRGRRGLKLGQLSGHVQRVLPGSSPSHLVLYVGTNDVGQAKKHELFLLLDTTLGRLHEHFPNARMIWSDILPRRTYSGFSKDEQLKIDRTRRALNKHARRICRTIGGSALTHLGIRHERRELFRRDGIHLSETGNNMFLHSLIKGLENMA
ncbi:uncharacterized protein LOC105444964 [Strongylocentrotus purpuratus]|uniref:SGNH hydrolase-type esterase domain-containing protein n=1 Tax=Strongylocentrotus purpuratus TaxID=7668 RepID=A0A7M7P444_STRPU|nr:uncharacterized protein LOC105444964 [Strongylocentrotus purpuratus]